MRIAQVTNKYCLPLIKRKRADIEASIDEHAARYRFFEVWVDYIDDITPEFATSIVSRYPHRLIMVSRRQNFEAQKMPADLRFEIFKSLSRKQVLVDLDIAHQTEDIKRLQGERITLKTILSYHNYSQTPSDTELRSIASRAASWGAHITKISTFCSIQRDALRLLSLLIDLRESGRRCVVLGMGKHGVITRVFGSQWGNEIAFAPMEVGQRSAPGQLPLDKLDSIMQALG